jgi:DNA primase
MPEYRKILEETVDHCRNPHFTATRYFLSHPDPVICRIAVRLSDEKRYPRMDLQEQPDISFMLEKDRIEWGRGLEKQMEAFVRSIRLDLFALKSAYIIRQMSDIEKKIKDIQLQGKIDEEMDLMREHQRLDKNKKVLSKELGERIILKM